LLAHLGHYNQSMKLDALNSLKEMLLANSELVKLEFINLLENVCPLFTDREYKVREAAMHLFKTLILLPHFRSSKNILKPFYPLINVHLSCAMTHIMDNIQHSSLKLLDILIEHLPDLVRSHAYTIFENFIEQISKANLKGDKRTLKNDPYKLTSTQTWRHNVLNRLHRMLLIISSLSPNQTLTQTSTETAAHHDLQNTHLETSQKTSTKTISIDFNNENFHKCLIEVNTSHEMEMRNSFKLWFLI